MGLKRLSALLRLRRHHPSRVPGCERAVADERKFTKYLLNPESERGRHKARFFSALGYDLSNWRELHDVFLREVPYVPGRYTSVNLANPPGENWEAVIRLKGPTGTADVITAWAVSPDLETHFVTAYPV
jgi:uncharacterized protein DUF6883